MKIQILLLAALVVAGSGCFGLPPGSAAIGDTVSIRYSAFDADTGELLRANRTATFVVGSGSSGLGLTLEREVRGRVVNDTFGLTGRSDPTLQFTETSQVTRRLSSIPMLQDAPRSEFDGSQFGPASVGKTFPAYGIYTGVVTLVNATSVSFEVRAQDGQEDAVPSVGSILVSHVVGNEITRELKPVIGSVFSIQPPSIYQSSTPLGLAPGSYKVTGSTDTHLLFSYTRLTSVDLLERPLRYEVTVLRVTPGTSTNVPEGDNYGLRNSPQVNGDPHSIAVPPSTGGHAH
jgi:hypothetical protein